METERRPNVACNFMEYLKNLFLISMNTPHQYYANNKLTTSLELLCVLKENYNVVLILWKTHTYIFDNTVTFLDIHLTRDNNPIN